jgi:hypothetical protein
VRGMNTCSRLIVPEASNTPWSHETRVRAPDGTEYVVRVAGHGIHREAFGNAGIWTAVLWKLRRRKRWNAEVFRVGRHAVEEPHVLSETYTGRPEAEARAAELEREIVSGHLGWDEWHRRL